MSRAPLRNGVDWGIPSIRIKGVLPRSVCPVLDVVLELRPKEGTVCPSILGRLAEMAACACISLALITCTAAGVLSTTSGRRLAVTVTSFKEEMDRFRV